MTILAVCRHMASEVPAGTAVPSTVPRAIPDIMLPSQENAAAMVCPVNRVLQLCPTPHLLPPDWRSTLAAGVLKILCCLLKAL